MSDEKVRLALRVHDECNGSDVFGSDICTCRPYLIYGIEEAVKEAQKGGSGVVIYFRKEGRALGEVTKVKKDAVVLTGSQPLRYYQNFTSPFRIILRAHIFPLSPSSLILPNPQTSHQRTQPPRQTSMPHACSAFDYVLLMTAF